VRYLVKIGHFFHKKDDVPTPKRDNATTYPTRAEADAAAQDEIDIITRMRHGAVPRNDLVVVLPTEGL